MTQPSVALATSQETTIPNDPAPSQRLRGRWLLLARIAWLLIAAGMLAGFINGILVYAGLARTVCTYGQAASGFLYLPTPDNARALHRLSLSLDVYTTVIIASLAVVSLVFLAQVREQLLIVVQETMQPAHASLWLRQPAQPSIEQTHRLEPPADGPVRLSLD